MAGVTTRTTRRDLQRLARELADRLRARCLRIVFAESCTGGLVSATLATVAGVSKHHCGSAVVYREETKAAWLGVSRDDLAHAGPVSPFVAEAMALGVLERTPEADLAVSVTGHLGPEAPPDLDGVVYVGAAARLRSDAPAPLFTRQILLEQPMASSSRNGLGLRHRRQLQAAARTLELAMAAIEMTVAGGNSTTGPNVC